MHEPYRNHSLGYWRNMKLATAFASCAIAIVVSGAVGVSHQPAPQPTARALPFHAN